MTGLLHNKGADFLQKLLVDMVTVSALHRSEKTGATVVSSTKPEALKK